LPRGLPAASARPPRALHTPATAWHGAGRTQAHAVRAQRMLMPRKRSEHKRVLCSHPERCRIHPLDRLPLRAARRAAPPPAAVQRQQQVTYCQRWGQASTHAHSAPASAHACSARARAHIWRRRPTRRRAGTDPPHPPARMRGESLKRASECKHTRRRSRA
jgi:hypothetical protein